MASVWEHDVRDASSALAFLRVCILRRRLETPTPTPTPSDSGSSQDGDTHGGWSDSDVGSDGVDLEATPPVSDVGLPATPSVADGDNSSSDASAVPSRVGRTTIPASASSGDGVDYISNLPDNLLDDIVSRLSLKEAIRTGGLSRRWRAVWREMKLKSVTDEDLLAAGHLVTAGGASLLTSVLRYLETRQGNIPAARITNISFGGRFQELQQLILLLKQKEVGDLVLIHNPLPFGLPLPTEILSFSGLYRLHLGFWQFPAMTTVSCLSGLHYLKELCLSQCIISDTDMNTLFHYAPCLETFDLVLSRAHPSRPNLATHQVKIPYSLRLAVVWMCSIEELMVDNAPRLERLMLHNSLPDQHDATIISIISAPMLKVLGFLDLSQHELLINNHRIEVGMVWRADATISTLKILGVKINLTVEREVKLLAVLLRCFPNLETLHVMSTSAGPISSTDAQIWESEESIECARFKIHNLVFHGFWGKDVEFQFIRYLAKEGMALRTIGVICENGVLDKQWKLTSSGHMSARVLVLPQSATRFFSSTIDTAVWAQSPFWTMAMRDDEGRRGLEFLPSILEEVGRKAEGDAEDGSCQSTGIAIHRASHTWCFQSALDLDVEDPFFKSMGRIA